MIDVQSNDPPGGWLAWLELDPPHEPYRSIAAAWRKERTEAADAIERLTRERDDAEKLAESLQNKWASRPLDHPSGDALVAENDRLRAALQQLDAYREGLRPMDLYQGSIILDMANIADEALRGAAETTAALPAHCPKCGEPHAAVACPYKAELDRLRDTNHD